MPDKKLQSFVHDCLITGFNLNAFYNDEYNADFKAAQKKYTKKFKKISNENLDTQFLKAFQNLDANDQTDYLITLLRVADEKTRQTILSKNHQSPKKLLH